MDHEAFFLPDGDRFLATPLTRGPWDPDAQHAGPPSALLGRAVEQAAGTAGRVARITVEIERPIPIAALSVTATPLRSGRSVQLWEAELHTDGALVARARAWWLRTSAGSFPVDLAVGSPPPPLESAAHRPFFDTGEAVGYHTATEWRFTRGGFTDPGPAAAWARQRVPLVAGEEPSPLQRVLVLADAGNGLSATTHPHRYLFINVDLTVHLLREPVGEWIHLDAVTRISGDGIGLAETRLSDPCGGIGRGAQTLLVRPR